MMEKYWNIQLRLSWSGHSKRVTILEVAQKFCAITSLLMDYDPEKFMNRALWPSPKNTIIKDKTDLVAETIANYILAEHKRDIRTQDKISNPDIYYDGRWEGYGICLNADKLIQPLDVSFWLGGKDGDIMYMPFSEQIPDDVQWYEKLLRNLATAFEPNRASIHSREFVNTTGSKDFYSEYCGWINYFDNSFSIPQPDFKVATFEQFNGGTYIKTIDEVFNYENNRHVEIGKQEMEFLRKCSIIKSKTY